MMDLSDGVATDAHRLCRMSQVGVIVEEAALPVDPVTTAACAWLAEHGASFDPLELALTGGEDFELLLTAPPSSEPALRALLAPLPLTRIGVISVERELLLQQPGRRIPLPWGFTHF
jgi:thiamine-monophosphate kinase